MKRQCSNQYTNHSYYVNFHFPSISAFHKHTSMKNFSYSTVMKSI
ncbi:hypothetical protein KSS87_007438 [Heliosperma pusillum]|nr:hypothetical protein KSS87_014171 [Heliosperma pusillum]KAH9612695.1 hypothetical protein KSS87_007438 [Heliosperma pusillum]